MLCWAVGLSRALSFVASPSHDLSFVTPQALSKIQSGGREAHMLALQNELLEKDSQISQLKVIRENTMRSLPRCLCCPGAC